MPDITTLADPIQQFAAVTVEHKADLVVASAWTETPGLYCNRLSTRVNGVDQADLFYAAGYKVARREGGGYVTCHPLDLIDQFVRVTIDDGTTTYRWHGVVVDDQVLRGGVQLIGGERKYLFQDQGFSVAGLEYLLDRRRIDSAIVDDTTRIGRSLAFNADSTARLTSSRATRGNRSSVTNSDGVYAFAKTPGGSIWDAADMVEYLLKYFTPVDSLGAAAPVEWALDVGATLLLTDYYPTFDPTGMTTYEVLNALLNPKRGFCWWVDYDPEAGAGGQAIVKFASLATSDVSLPGGGTLPENTDQQSVDFDLDPTAHGVQKFGNRRRRYNRIRARGAPITSTFTVGFGDSTLEADWQAALETAYKAAASGLGSYPTDDDERKAMNDAYRRRSIFRGVYSAFRIPDDWDLKSGDGGATSPAVARDWAIADVLQSGSIVGSLPVMVDNLRVLPRTLLKTGVDYSDPSNLVDHNPSGTEPDLEPPFAVVKIATSPDKWQFADKLSSIDTTGSTEVGDIKTSYHLYAQQQAPGVRLQATSGSAHSLAVNHWASAAPTAHEPELDYESMVVTLAVEADTRVEGAWPALAPGGVMLDELVLEAGDDYRLDYLAAGTVVDVVAGSLVLADATDAVDYLLRDDRDALQDLARQAYEWYQTDRAGLQFALTQTRKLFDRGTLITTIGDAETQETVNTVIGQVSYDFLQGRQQIVTLGDAIDLPALLT